MSPISIRYPLIKESTGNRRGRRYRLMPDTKGLHGASRCAAGMVTCAIRKRDLSLSAAAYRSAADAPVVSRIDRVSMRMHALWARVFAGHLATDDARLLAAEREHTELVRAYCGHCQAA